MNIFYLSLIDFNDVSMCGVVKKIKSQIKSLEELNNSVIYTCFEGNELVLYNKNKKRIIHKFNNKIEKRFKLYNIIFNEIIKKENIEFIYMRYSTTDIYMLKFFKKVKQKGVITYIEIPTYPYDKERPIIQKSMLTSLSVISDRIYRNYLKNNINKFVTSSGEYEFIFGAPCLRVDNGINVNEIEFIEKQHDYNLDKIILIGVAFVNRWHGYDRVIEGLNNYYNQENVDKVIEFKIIGDGPEISNLKLLVQKYNLEEYVRFEGIKTGKELDLIYKEAHIAIGGLGMYRKQINTIATLKVREYCAYGIPFVYAAKDPGLKGDEAFALKVENDGTPLCIYKIIDLYNRVYLNDNIRYSMRKYAEMNFDWKIQMNKIINSI